MHIPQSGIGSKTIYAAIKPYRENIGQPERSTIQSPRFRYPCKGEGILITIVATQVSAACIAEKMIF